MELGALEVKRLAALADAFLAGAEGREVGRCLGHRVAIESKLDAPGVLPSDGNVEERPLADFLVRVARLALAAPLLHHIVQLLPVLRSASRTQENTQPKQPKRAGQG